MSNLKTCNPPYGHKQKYCSRVPGTESLKAVSQKTQFSPLAGTANDANDANDERADVGKEAIPFDDTLNDPNGIEWSK